MAGVDPKAKGHTVVVGYRVVKSRASISQDYWKKKTGDLGDGSPPPVPQKLKLFVKLHIIFALKYNKQQLLLLLDKITSKILGGHYLHKYWGTCLPLSYRDQRLCVKCAISCKIHTNVKLATTQSHFCRQTNKITQTRNLGSHTDVHTQVGTNSVSVGIYVDMTVLGF